MKRTMSLILALILVLVMCACGAKNEETATAAESTSVPVVVTGDQTSTESANITASEQVAAEQSKAGALVGEVSMLSNSTTLVVDSGGNVYCFMIPTGTDLSNMIADNKVTVYFDGELNSSYGTAYQPVTITKIEFQQIVQVGDSAATQTTQTTQTTQVTQQTTAATPTPTDAPATQTAEGAAIVYMWKDGTVHDTPEEGQQAVTASQVATINFTEPTITGEIKSCNGTILGFVENEKYILIDNGLGNQFLFLYKDKPIVSYDGSLPEVGKNVSVMYKGTLNPNYGKTSPQYVEVVNIQVDSKYYYYQVISPKTTATPAPTPKNNGMWLGTDGNLHWYGSDGKVYHYDSKGNIVLS